MGMAIVGLMQRVMAQSEWINYDQSYYKIKTAQEGIHQITYDQLQTAGFLIAAVNTANVQVFFRGEELNINVVDGGDNQWDPGDYLEFYGLRNDGTLENALYVSAEAQPHQFFNLYSDTTAFFLTWSQNPGKRMSLLAPSDPGLTARDYHWEQQLMLQTDNYSFGRRYPEGGFGETYRSQFDFGEGWTGTRIFEGNTRDFVFSEVVLTNPSAGQAPQLEVLLAGRNDGLHNVEVLVGSASSLRSLGTVQFVNFDNFLFQSPLEWSDIPADGQLTVQLSVTSSGTDRISPSYFQLRYPQQWDLNGQAQKTFEIPPDGNNEASVTISSVPNAVTVYDITDWHNVQIIQHTTAGTDINLIVPNTSTTRKLLVTETSLVTDPPMELISFRAIDPNAHDYLIVSHHSLMKPGGSYDDPVKAYAEYRASEEGGSYDTLVVDMDFLYNQYNYGEISPLAIRKFVEAMLPGDPQYLFLLGKGFNVHFQPYRQDMSTATTFDLVPTVGFPGSDIALTAGLAANPNLAALPTGRVNARTPLEVAGYLDKVKETEATSFDELWRKDIIHLSGGLTQSELTLFKNYVDQFKAVAEGPYFGGKVTTVNKQSNETTVLINVADEVNEGVSLITFFGHSSTSTTDIEIGKVTDATLGYDNQGRYPMIMVNGCNAGNAFFTSVGFGEDWILAQNKGALGFLAHTDAGFAANLKRYSDIFYELAYGDSVFLSKPMGDILQELGSRYLQSVAIDEIQIAQVQQEVYQGDPAFGFFRVDKPDFQTEDQLISLQTFDGQNLNAQVDSFQVAFIARNFGRTTEDSLNVTVRRTFGDGQLLIYDSVFYAPVSYQDTLFFTIRSNNISNFGNNVFEVLLDYNQSIDELNETNNVGVLQFFIPQGGTVNLQPYNYAIIDAPQVDLIAQASDLISGTRNFLMEIDTTKNFDSPWKSSTSQTGDGLTNWQVSLLPDNPPQDSTVYYWRSRFVQPKVGEDTAWTVSSFINIAGSPEGWSQAQFPQFDEDFTDEGITRNQALRRWEFTTTENLVEITTYGMDHPLSDPANISVTIDGQPFIVSTRLCPINSFNAIAFDKASTVPYAVLTTGGFDVLDRNRCGRTPQVINTFTNNDVRTTTILEDYIDQLPTGDYAVLFSIGQVNYTTWTTATIDKLTEIGVDQSDITVLQIGEPVIILGRKGDPPGTALIIKADNTLPTPIFEQEISFSQILTGNFSTGTIVSPKIGPALSWGTLYKQIEALPEDLVLFQVLGIDTNGSEQVLFDDVTVDVLDLNAIDPVSYPFLRIRVIITDETQLSPPQLKRWQVIYESAPEGVLLFRGNKDNLTRNIPLNEGEEYRTNFTFFNISNKAFADSLTVRSTLFNREKRTSTLEEFRLAALASNDSITFSVNLQSEGQGGINDFRVFVNPNILPEQVYNNNVNDFQEYIEVNVDNTHPVLDVTFDGIYILDGDIVSPSPLITIALKDDNTFSFKQDTVGMEVFLKYQDPDCPTCDFVRVNFSDPQVQWYPATDNEDFRIEYRPQNLVDGLYTLQVQGADNNGQQSGVQPYAINFEVINESTITHFYPYPNPFSTRTRFVFTLTGAEIPGQIKIQIMTVTGKVVREITQDELGPIRIGNNITDYAWDGRDEFGDQLANGVYLYRVLMNHDGDSFEHRQTSADKAFKKGYGKLYLLR